MTNRIKHALYFHGWSFSDGDKIYLKNHAQRVLVSEYNLSMKGHIFCPECSANLFRSPEEKDFDRNQRPAHFKHCPGISTECGLRTKPAEGKRYLTEEDAKKAIQDGDLVIVSGFIKEKPVAPEKESSEYDATLVESTAGPLANIPISRHRGESFNLPSTFQTIRGICNKFDENLYRYFYMPGGKYAVQLQDLLNDVESVTGEEDKPRIYYGRIIDSYNAGKTVKNIRMTKLKFKRGHFADFYLKLTDEMQGEKGIGDSSKGRVVLMHGSVTTSGAGLSIENIGWGEFALLPKKYENLLYPSGT